MRSVAFPGRGPAAVGTVGSVGDSINLSGQNIEKVVGDEQSSLLLEGWLWSRSEEYETG